MSSWFCIPIVHHTPIDAFYQKEEQDIREEFLKLDTDHSGFITKGKSFFSKDGFLGWFFSNNGFTTWGEYFLLPASEVKKSGKTW